MPHEWKPMWPNFGCFQCDRCGQRIEEWFNSYYPSSEIKKYVKDRASQKVVRLGCEEYVAWKVNNE
jgi:hypothetical protein